MKGKSFGIVLGALCLIGYVWGYVLAELTLVSWWSPVALALALAAGGYLLLGRKFEALWRRWTKMEGRPAAMLAYLFFAGSPCWFGPLAVNSCLAPPDSAYEETVTVVKKEHVVRTKYRRVGRHRRVADGVRHVYYLRVAFADGFEKRYPVSQAEYNRTRESAEKTVSLRMGFLGIPVIHR